jgi:2',3'-cyclic-nucleotide 2'-phosphodiesterase (5'-nucleotidase family)
MILKRPFIRISLTILLGFFLLAACTPKHAAPTRTPAAATLAPSTPQNPSPATTQSALPGPRRLTVLYTNDEHGWMEGVGTGQGAANLFGLWREKEGYTPDGAYLILSGGDNWTGPAISTWFQGQSMVEVMNAMGYAASTIGNHEFDFGLDMLKRRISEANFPYVSANIRYRRDGSTPTDLGIQPYVVINVGLLRVGITGLTTYATTTSTNPANIKDLTFMDYEAALREIVPQARLAGAELILVSGHACPEELAPLAMAIPDLEISLIGAGHCEQAYSKRVGDTVVVTGNSRMAGYGYATFEYDFATQAAAVVQFGIRDNHGGEEDPAVAEIVTRWRKETDAQLDVQIGYLKQTLNRGGSAVRALIVESWLLGYPTADVAITNPGGIRDDLKAGPVTLADIISVMPFDNVLIQTNLTGKQIVQVLNTASSPVIGGLHQQGGQWILDKTGQPLEAKTTYSVLVNDFMYNGGDGYTLLAKSDPNGYNTAINWRQPVIDWIRLQDSTPAQPLDAAIQDLSR